MSRSVPASVIVLDGGEYVSMHVMVVGTLVSDPVQPKSQAGKSFVTASMRVACDGAEPFLASLIAFSQTAAQVLVEHGKGDTIVAGGRANLNQWQGKDGVVKHGVGIVVEQVMSEYQFAKRRRAAERDGAEHE